MTEPIGPGAFVAVVGASGVGKDALLAYARERSDALVRFPRRAITRPPGPGEDHEPMTTDQFAKALDQGAFAMYWDAHGLRYGIPASVDAEVRDGLVVVANVSRSVVDQLDARYQRLVVVSVTVPEEVRAQRLRGRRRESEPGIGQRLARPDPAPGHRNDAVIQNDGSLADGGAQLLRLIEAARCPAGTSRAIGSLPHAVTALHAKRHRTGSVRCGAVFLDHAEGEGLGNAGTMARRRPRMGIRERRLGDPARRRPNQGAGTARMGAVTAPRTAAPRTRRRLSSAPCLRRSQATWRGRRGPSRSLTGSRRCHPAGR